MTHWTPDHDADDDDADDWGVGGDDAEHLSAAELPDAADTDPPADDADTVPCPFCGRAVYEFADVCPKCRNFIGGTGPAGRPQAVVGDRRHRAVPGRDAAHVCRADVVRA